MTKAALQLLLSMKAAERAFDAGGGGDTSHRRFAGIDVEIENPAGSTRSGTSKAGKSWSVKMAHDYGYIPKAHGADGEGLDVFLGPDQSAPNVHVIHQNDPSTGQYDEDKCVLGCRTPEEAKALYLANYNTPAFYRSTTIIPIAKFKEMLTRGEPGSVHWKKKHGRDLEAGAMFDAGGMAFDEGSAPPPPGYTWETIAGRHLLLNSKTHQSWQNEHKGEHVPTKAGESGARAASPVAGLAQKAAGAIAGGAAQAQQPQWTESKTHPGMLETPGVRAGSTMFKPMAGGATPSPAQAAIAAKKNGGLRNEQAPSRDSLIQHPAAGAVAPEMPAPSSPQQSPPAITGKGGLSRMMLKPNTGGASSPTTQASAPPAITAGTPNAPWHAQPGEGKKIQFAPTAQPAPEDNQEGWGPGVEATPMGEGAPPLDPTSPGTTPDAPSVPEAENQAPATVEEHPLLDAKTGTTLPTVEKQPEMPGQSPEVGQPGAMEEPAGPQAAPGAVAGAQEQSSTPSVPAPIAEGANQQPLLGPGGQESSVPTETPTSAAPMATGAVPPEHHQHIGKILDQHSQILGMLGGAGNSVNAGSAGSASSPATQASAPPSIKGGGPPNPPEATPPAPVAPPGPAEASPAQPDAPAQNAPESQPEAQEAPDVPVPSQASDNKRDQGGSEANAGGNAGNSPSGLGSGVPAPAPEPAPQPPKEGVAGAQPSKPKSDALIMRDKIAARRGQAPPAPKPVTPPPISARKASPAATPAQKPSETPSPIESPTLARRDAIAKRKAGQAAPPPPSQSAAPSAPKPQTPAAAAISPRKTFTKAKASAPGASQDDAAADKELSDASGAGHPFTFHRELPGEVQKHIGDYPQTKKLFKTTENTAEAGGANAYGQLGERYFEHANRHAQSGRAAQAEQKQAKIDSPDPDVKFRAALREHKPDTKVPSEKVHPKDLSAGMKMTTQGGIPLQVTQDEEHGGLRLHDGPMHPNLDAPVEALQGHIPIDKGSIQHEDPEAGAVGDFDFGHNALEAAPEPEAKPPQVVDPSRQLGLYAKDDKGNAQEVGEKIGQANLFDRSGPKAPVAPTHHADPRDSRIAAQYDPKATPALPGMVAEPKTAQATIAERKDPISKLADSLEKAQSSKVISETPSAAKTIAARRPKKAATAVPPPLSAATQKKTAAPSKPASTPGKGATDEQVHQAVQELSAKAGGGTVPNVSIKDLRQHLAAAYGPEAANHANLNPQLKRMRGDKVRMSGSSLVSAGSDRETQEDLVKHGIQGMGEHFTHIAPQAPGDAPKTSASPQSQTAFTNEALHKEFQGILDPKTDIVDIAHLRDNVRDKYGDKAASPEVFDRMVHNSGLRMVPVSDRANYAKHRGLDVSKPGDLKQHQENLRKGIPGADEHFMYLSRGGNDFSPSSETPAPQQSSGLPVAAKTVAPQSKSAGEHEIFNVAHDLMDEEKRKNPNAAHMLAIHDLRDAVEKRYGPEAASDKNFNAAMKKMRGSKMRFIASDYHGAFTPDQLRKGIPGYDTEHFMHIGELGPREGPAPTAQSSAPAPPATAHSELSSRRGRGKPELSDAEIFSRIQAAKAERRAAEAPKPEPLHLGPTAVAPQSPSALRAEKVRQKYQFSEGIDWLLRNFEYASVG